MKSLLLRNLSVGYGRETIIENLSLEVGERQSLTLMGASGSGKSTLLLAILGILTPSSGEIVLNGRSIAELPIESRNIGYLPQDYGLFPHLNVLENVSFGLLMRGMSAKDQMSRAQQMLELVDLKGFDSRKIRELSGGQRQRVGLARALAISPDLLLLDEPLSNIDQVTKFEVATNLRNLFAQLEIPVIVVTHNHEDARFLSKELAILIEGKIAQRGDVNEILKHPKNDFIKRLLSPFDFTQ